MKTKIPAEYVAAYLRYSQGLPNGMTIYDISDLMQKSPSTIYHALREAGVDTSSHRKREEARNKKLVGAYQPGKRTLEEVGGQFGVSKQRAQQIIRREALRQQGKAS